MNRALAAFLVLSQMAFALNSQRISGDNVGGAGIAEKNVVFGYMNLPNYIELCELSDGCKLEPWEKELLKKIKTSLPQEGSVEKILSFQSEKENPGFFMVDGYLRIAKTGNKIGSPIFFNLDLLYSANLRSELKPLSLSSGVALLIHELGHHHGITDHLKLDVLGTKVQTAMTNNIEQVSGRGQYSGLEAMVINSASGKAKTQVLVRDRETVYDLTEELEKETGCVQYIEDPNGGVVFANEPFKKQSPVYSKPIDYSIWNLHWGLVQRSNASYGPAGKIGAMPSRASENTYRRSSSVRPGVITSDTTSSELSEETPRLSFKVQVEHRCLFDSSNPTSEEYFVEVKFVMDSNHLISKESFTVSSTYNHQPY